MADIKIIGDSVLKGTIFDSETGNFHFHNYLETIPNSENLSKFGCTVTKGADYIKRLLAKDNSCKKIIMNFGGNDSDYIWKEISDNPYNVHGPKTPVEVFVSTYVDLIRHIKSLGITPIVTTLTPIDGRAYFDYFCNYLDCIPEQVMIWLKDINRLGDNQQRYSEIVKQIAEQENIPLVDLRKAFLESSDYKVLLCNDGIHPNEKGQSIILEQLMRFV